MKVLFAVNNDSISEAIVKKYLKEYKEIISYKNVYYFNAILKELQNNKNYDSVVISEDLEPFANNNFDTIDKFLFEKLDKISDEATKANGNNIEIILICSDRRNKSDEMLTKIFGIGIYNALIGDDRNLDNLCRLINQPRNKKDAKIVYGISGVNVGYQAESENNVSESEVQNILAHYKRLGKDEDKYVDSFNNIVSQYTDIQLKIIIKYLPLHVKAVLEERSPKYQELASLGDRSNTAPLNNYKPKVIETDQKQEKFKVRMLDKEKKNINKPILIPSALQISNKQKVELKHNNNKQINVTPKSEIENNITEDDILEEIKGIKENKRGRGRPKKIVSIEHIEENPKRGRGRPKKITKQDEVSDDDNDKEDTALYIEDNKTNNIKDHTDTDEIDLFNINEDTDEIENETDLFNLNEEIDETENEADIFNINEEVDETDDDTDLFNLNEEKNETDDIDVLSINEEDADLFNISNVNDNDEIEQESKSIQIQAKSSTSEINTLLTKEKKIVSFVGTTKNGTSFVVNNLALILSSMNISTAILDLTQSKNAYYIFTKNEQRLRDIADSSITSLANGLAKGIEINKNLTVYTELPGKEPDDFINPEDVLATLLKTYDVILIDTDFKTPIDYFEKSQEIYLVQSMDILTIQPLTAFLRMLKAKNVLNQEKLKVVINKSLKIKSLSDKTLIGGLASYNDPSMSYMTELFEKNKITYCNIPFEIQNYLKYIDSLVNCELTLKGYTKQLISSLNGLAGIVYPLINRQTYSPMGNKKPTMEFSNSTKDILNKMKKNY